MATFSIKGRSYDSSTYYSRSYFYDNVKGLSGGQALNSNDGTGSEVSGVRVSQQRSSDGAYLIYIKNVSGGTAQRDWFDDSLFRPATHSVTYAANGGSSTPSSQTKTWGSVLTLRGAISRSSTSTTATITFNANGGSSTKTSQSSTQTTTYTFAGWKSSYDGGVYSASGQYGYDADTTMTAQWTSSTGNYTSVTLPTAAQCTRDKYNLLGFSTTKYADDAAVASNLTAPGSSITPTGSATYYAAWERAEEPPNKPKSVTVTYAGNVSWVTGEITDLRPVVEWNYQLETNGSLGTIQTFAKATTSTTFTVADNTKYSAWVRASNDTGDSDWTQSNYVWGKPLVPVNLGFTNAGVITWAVSSSQLTDLPVTKHEIQWYVDDVLQETIEVSGTVFTYNAAAKMQNNSKYYCKVRAVNSAGASNWTAASAVQYTMPVAPQEFYGYIYKNGQDVSDSKYYAGLTVDISETKWPGSLVWECATDNTGTNKQTIGTNLPLSGSKSPYTWYSDVLSNVAKNKKWYRVALKDPNGTHTTSYTSWQEINFRPNLWFKQNSNGAVDGIRFKVPDDYAGTPAFKIKYG